MTRKLMMAEYIVEIKQMVEEKRHHAAQMQVVAAVTDLTEMLRRDMIGMEWFSTEIRALLDAARW